MAMDIKKIRVALAKQTSDLAAAEAAAILAHKIDQDAGTAAAMAGKALPAPTAPAAEAKAAQLREVVAALQRQLKTQEDAEAQASMVVNLRAIAGTQEKYADGAAIGLACMQVGYAYYVAVTGARPPDTGQLFWHEACTPKPDLVPPLVARANELRGLIGSNSAEPLPSFALPTEAHRARAAAALSDLFDAEGD